MALTPRERVLRAFDHEEPDRVPVFEPYGVLPPTADVVLGRPCVATSQIRGIKLFSGMGKDRYEETVRRDILDLVEKLGFDAGPLAAGAHYVPDSPPEMIDDNSWTIGGSIFRYLPDSGVTLEVDSHIKRGGMSALEEHVASMEEQSDEEIEEGVREHGVNDKLVSALRRMGLLLYTAGGTNPTTSSWVTLYLRSFHQRPDLARRFLGQATRRVALRGKVASDFGCELMFIGGDIAGNDGPMVSPNIFREFILPEMRAQADSLHKHGIFSVISSDGCLWPIIDDYLRNSGVDGMMEIQVTAGMDLDELKGRFGDRISFTGSVDCQYTLTTGAPRDAAHETRRAIDSLSPGGGHILCSSNSIHAGVKPGNYLAMLRTARRNGKYRP
ncbi:MAG: hypothetical protein HXS50_01845 [Theionarchaea archaeon]|nr:hypothetical protein [Theionarchaea archaeon]